MNDRYENILSMLEAVHTYLGSPAASLLLTNGTVNTRRAALATFITSVGTLSGNRATLAAESIGATAGKATARAELNRLLLKMAKGVESCFRATGDVENATAVRVTRSKVERMRDSAVTTFVALIQEKASTLGSSLAAHNITSADTTALSTAASAWAALSSKSTSRRAASSAKLKAAEAKIDEACAFLKDQLDPIIQTFTLSASEPDRTAATGYFNARTIIDLHGPGGPAEPEEPTPPVPPGPRAD